MSNSLSEQPKTLRIGAVNYLNSKPLICGLEQGSSLLEEDQIKLYLDLPSRLADSLAAGRLDIALIPSIELFQNPEYRIVSDACIACQGPVLSVKLFFRVPPAEVRRMALDEGSRTSVALAKILLDELHGITPLVEPLAIGDDAESSDADAILLIGDRAIRSVKGEFSEVWDLGEEWTRYSGLPFVFAMWVAREGGDLEKATNLLSQIRDRGLVEIESIVQAEAKVLSIDADLARRYLRENLHFTLGDSELQGFRKYYRLCAERGLVPSGMESMIDRSCTDDCTIK